MAPRVAGVVTWRPYASVSVGRAVPDQPIRSLVVEGRSRRRPRLGGAMRWQPRVRIVYVGHTSGENAEPSIVSGSCTTPPDTCWARRYSAVAIA
jgi:hypothetical protein